MLILRFKKPERVIGEERSGYLSGIRNSFLETRGGCVEFGAKAERVRRDPGGD